MMARTGLDTMLRHLGAAYYGSLHGRAARSEAARALDAVEAYLDERPPGPAARPRLVGDVMTTSVVSVSPGTPAREIARLLARHGIGAVPVLERGWKVVGLVSGTGLRAAQDSAARQARVARVAARPGRPGRRHLTAADVMTAPAVTVAPDATIPAAVRLMDAHHLARLLVTGTDGQLLGIVSRRDLLGVFLRPDLLLSSQTKGTEVPAG
jgi:CBS domain-containing protein